MIFSPVFLFLLLPCHSLQTTANEKKTQSGNYHPSPLVKSSPTKRETSNLNANKSLPSSAKPTHYLISTNQNLSSSTKPSDVSNQRTSKKEASPSPAQHPIKVLISDACIQRDSTKDITNTSQVQVQSQELDLERGSPLVLTHQINLVPGSCGGCEAEFTSLQNRLERLEKEVSTLKRKCADGAACSLRSDGNECPNDCSDQGRCKDGKCVCFPGFNGYDCGSPSCLSDCNNNGKCVNGQCECDKGFSGPDCANKSCPGDCHNQGQCLKGKCMCHHGFTGPDCSIAPSSSLHLRSKDVTDASVTLLWTLPAIQHSAYHITFKSQRAGDENITAKVGGRLSNFTQTGLAAGQKYKVSIRGERDGKMDPESTTEFTTAQSSPLHLRSRDITDGSVTLYWTLPSVSYSTYHITFKSQKEEDEKITAEVTGGLSSFTQTGLAAGQKYKVSIRGKKDGKMGPESSIEITTAPSGSIQLRSRDITDSSVALYWTLPSVSYNTYHITFKSQRDGDKEITANIAGRLSSYTQTGLAAGQKYKVSIRGEKAGKMGPVSSTELTTAPSGFVHLRSRDITDSSVTLYWTLPSVSYNTYHITFKSQREGARQITANIAGRLSSYTQTGLAAGQKYKVSIRGERDEKMGPESTIEFTTAPSGSIPLQSRDITDSSVTLYWALPSVSYNTYHITFKSQREGDKPITTNIAGRLSSYIQTGLAAGQKYKVSIRGERDGKIGPESTIEFTTAPSGSIQARSKDITDSSVTLYWTLPSVSYNTYHITFKSQRAGDKQIPANIAGRLSSYTQTGLAAGQKYKVSIRGERDGKMGPESSIEITTAPSGFVHLRSRDITDSSVTLYWTLPSVSYNTYHITFKSQREGDKQITATTAGRLSSYTQTGLAAGQKYKVSIRGERDGKMGPESTIEFTTAPSGSIPLRSRDITDSSVTLYWTLPSVSYNTYHITFKSQREEDRVLTAEVAGRLSSYTQTGLAAGQKYRVSIRGKKDGKMGPESSTEITTAPSGSIQLRSRDITDSSVTLYWTLPSVSYNTYHITFKSQNEQKTAVIEGRLSSFTQTGLTAGQKYKVSITGERAGRMGPESTMEFTTAPSGSVQLRSRDITDSSVTLYWTLPSVSYNTYHITFKSQREGDKQITAKVGGRLSSFTQTGLAAGQKYRVSIRGERDGKMGPESSTEFTTAPSGSLLLRSRDVTESSVTLFWMPPSVMYNTYHITFKSQREGDKQITAKVGGRLSSLTQTGLAAGQKYKVSIRGERDGKMGPESTIEFTTAPSGSVHLRSRDITDSSVTLYWTLPSVKYNTYHITFKSQKERDERITAQIGGRLSSFTQTGLAAGQKYRVSIRGEKDGKMGPESSTEMTTAPSGSIHLRSRDITDSSVTLYWTLPSVSYNTYHITFKSQKEGDEKITTQITGRLSSYTQTGLAAGQKYKVSIRGERDGKMGPESTIEITTAPSGSLHLRSRDITDSSVTLYWTLPSVPYNTYHITFKSQREGDKQITAKVGGRLSSYTQTGLAAGQKYRVSIRGERAGKMGPESSIEFTTAPSGSLHLRSRDVTDSSVTLYWPQPSVSYNTYHITFKSQREGDKPVTAKVAGRLSSYTQTGLAAGQKYKVSIRGERDGKMGPESTTEFTTAPSGSIQLRSRDITDSSVTLYWTLPSVSYNTYHITFKSQREGDRVITAEAAGRLSSYTQTGLAAGQKYKVSIRGKKDGKMGPESSTEITTAPSGSIQLRSRDITESSVTLFWTLPSVTYNTYHITFKSQREGDKQITANIVGRLSSYIQTRLAAGQKYRVSIRGERAGKMGPESSIEFTTAPSGAIQLRSRDTTDSSITLYWALPSVPYTTYHITFRSQREGDKQITANIAGRLSSYTQTGLAAGQKYKVSIRGERAGKMGPESTMEFMTAASGSVHFRSRDITDSSATLYWTLPSVSYNTYHITFKSQREGDKPITANIAGRLSSYTQTGLAAGQKYKVSIRGERDGKMGPESTTEFTTAPSGSIQLRSRDITDSSITLYWTLPSVQYSSYHITFKSQREGDKQITANIAGRLSSYTQTGLAAGQKYKVSIRGERDRKLGPESTIEFTTAPSGFVHLRSRDITESSVTLFWTLPSVSYNTYHITFKSQRDGDKPITTNIAGRLSSYTQTGLAAGQKYKVSIRGERDGKMGPESTIEFTTASSFSLHLGTRHITDSSVTLYWTLPSVPYTNYHITFQSQREGDERITAKVGGRLSSYTQTGLAAGQKYKVSIRGERAGKMGPESSTEFTTYISSPRNLHILKTTRTSILVQWESPVVDIDSYRISIAPNVTEAEEGKKEIQESTLPPDTDAANIDGLEEGRLYDITLVALKGRSQSQPIRVQAMPGDGKNIFTKVIVETVTAKVPREGDMIEEKKSSDKAELDKTLFHKKNEELKEKSSPKVGDSSTAKQGMYGKTDITSLGKKQKTVVSSDTAIDRKTHTGSGTRKTAQDGKRNGQASEKQTATSGRVESTKVMLPDSSLDSKQHTKLQPRPDVKATVTVKQESEARTRSKTDSLEAQARYSHTTQISSSSKESKTDSKYLTHSVKDTSSKSLSVKEVPEQTSLVEENAARTPTGKSVKKLAGHGYSVDSTTGLKTNSTVMKVDTKTTTTKVELTRGDKITTHKMSGSQGDVTVAGDNRPTGSVKTGTTQVNGTDRIHGSLGNGTARYSTKTGVGNGTDQTVKQRSESSQNVTVTLRTVSTTGTESRPAVAEGKTVFKTAGEAKANHTVSEEEKERKKGKAFTNREDTDKRPESSAKQVSKTEFSHKITTVQVSQSRSEGAGGTHVVTVRNETRVITQGNQGVRSNHSDIHTDSIISSTAQINRNHTSGSKIRHSHAKMTHNDTSSQTGLNITSPQTHSKDITETGRHQINVTSSSTRNAGIALTSVEVQNVTSRGFILIWEAPRGLFQNFVVTRREYVMGSTTEEEQEEEEEEEEIEEEEEEDINEEEISVTQESENKEEISSVSSNTTDSHRKSSEGSRHESPTKAHSRTTGRVTSKKFKRISQVVPGNARSLTFRNLRPHTRYSLTLFGKGSGLRSKIYRFFITTGPESPSELLFSNVTDSSLSVSWTKPKSSVTGFKVTYTHTEDGKSMSMSVDSQHSSVTLSQLSPASSYEVSVMSVLGQEESDPIRGLVITVPDPPTGLQAVNVTDTKALLQWKASLATVDRYIIVYGSENAPDTTVKVSGNTVEQQLKGLRTGTFYTVTITSQLGSLQSTRTTTTFTTAGGSGIIGEGIQELAVGQLTPRSAVLSWKSPRTLVTSYKMTYQKAGQITKEVVLPSTVTKFKLTGLSPLSKYNVRVQGERKGQYVTSISVELTTGSLRFPFPTDCSQELLNGMQQSGEVEVFPSGKQGKPVRVYCDMETDGGGWTVFQRRMNGETDFFRGWSDYSYGFGNLSGEFWLGNEQIHNLTSLRPMALRVDLRAGAESAHAYYSFFYVDSHKRHYTLRVSGYSGNAGDSMRYHNGRPFSTRDKDSNPSITRCATSYRGGWWYKNCHEANLNGLYNTSSSHQGVIWTDWKGKDFSIPFTEMKLRPASFPSRTHS